MRRDDQARLCELTDGLYQREVARLRGLHEEESRLRSALARLDAQARAARDLPDSALAGLREIGSDMAWQSWLAHQRAAVRDELARLLARKEHAMPAQRRAFGRAEAMRSLRAQAHSAACQRQERRKLATLGDLAVMARMGSGTGPDQVS